LDVKSTPQLTARKIANVKEPDTTAMAVGLYLQVSKYGASWIFRFIFDLKTRDMASLGRSGT
jgi:hypothetical protein